MNKKGETKVEQNKEIIENFGLTQKAIDILQEMENDLKSIYTELFATNTHYETIEEKLSDIASNTQNMM